MLVGITGPSGAGKGLVVEVFESNGFRIIDADKVAREVVMPGEPLLAKLTAVFGDDIITNDGTLNRRLLADRAFSSRENTDKMNQIMHASICRRMIDRADKFKEQGINCVFDAPLLFEAGLEKHCDCCIAVIAPVALRIQRLSKRDGITEGEIHKRLSMQHDDEYYISRSQYIITNDGSRSELAQSVQTIVRQIIDKYREG